MKTKQLCLLLLSMTLFAACEKTSLPAPANLQSYPSGDKIVLTWSGVNGASYYEVVKYLNGGGKQTWTVYNTSHTDYDPYDGVNSYEVRAVSSSGQYSSSSYTSVYYSGNSSGGNGEGGNNDGYLDYSNQNIAGVWKASWTRQTQLNEEYFKFDTNGNVQGVAPGLDYAFVYTGKYQFQGDNLVITYTKYEYYANGKAQSKVSMNQKCTYKMRGILNTGWMGWKTDEYDEISLYSTNSIGWPSNISTTINSQVVGTWEITGITYSSEDEYIYFGSDGVYKNVYYVNGNIIVRMGKWSATTSQITVSLIDGENIRDGLLKEHQYMGWTEYLEIQSVSSSQLVVQSGTFTKKYKKVNSIGITY